MNLALSGSESSGSVEFAGLGQQSIVAIGAYILTEYCCMSITSITINMICGASDATCADKGYPFVGGYKAR
jgi:hypothetical protein